MSENDGVIQLDGRTVREFGERAVRVIEHGQEQSAAVSEDLKEIETQAENKGVKVDKKAWRQAMKLLAGGEEKVQKWRDQTEAVEAVLAAFEQAQ